MACISRSTNSRPHSRWLSDESASAISKLLVCAALLGCVGCATHAQRLIGPRAAFYDNRLERAADQLEKLAEKPKRDETVIQLDRALVELMRGDVGNAEHRLRDVRDRWEQLRQSSLAEEAGAWLSDDGKRAYAGEDYEQVLVRVMLTLCSLLGDGVDAESYSLQTLALQQQMQARLDQDESRSVANYCIPPMAPYLRGILREATWNNYDDAARAYHRTLELLPDAQFVLQDLERVTHGVHCPPNHGVVYVIALVGRGPYKVEVAQPATQEAMLIAEQLLAAVSDVSVPPTLAPVKVPQIVSPPKPFDLVGVRVDGTAATTTLPITDIHQLATQSYATQAPIVMARTVARRILKKGAVVAAKDQLQATELGALAMDAAGVLWEASESADTRCWGVLPREIQITRLELPVGRHQLGLEPVTGGQPVDEGRSLVDLDVEVVDGRNTYVLSYWPGLQPIGQVLVSR